MGIKTLPTTPARQSSFGSPVKAIDAGANFSKLSSPFPVAAYIPHRTGLAFAESAAPSNHAGGYFAESGMGLPKSAGHLAKSAACFTAAGMGFTKSAEAFAESGMPFAASAGASSASETAFPQQIAEKTSLDSPIRRLPYFLLKPSTINHQLTTDSL